MRLMLGCSQIKRTKTEITKGRQSCPCLLCARYELYKKSGQVRSSWVTHMCKYRMSRLKEMFNIFAIVNHELVRRDHGTYIKPYRLICVKQPINEYVIDNHTCHLFSNQGIPCIMSTIELQNSLYL